MAAIILALYWIQSINVYVGTVIFSDSLSSLVAITEQKEISFVTKILTLTTNLKYQGKDVYFEWIPSHCGINGNEMADMYAKKALEKNIEINNKLSLSEIKHVILKKYIMEWQNRWNGAYHYLKQSQPIVNCLYPCILGRFHETILHRLRFGIIGLNFDLKRLNIHPTGFCDNCQIIESIEHFLMECPKFTIERAMLLTETNISDPNKIADLLKSSNTNIQSALVRFVLRTNRLYRN